MKNHFLNAALNYAQMGFHVIPCKTGEKKPILNKWQKKATTNPETIKDWWRKWPSANVAIVAGPASGIFVLDVDLPHGPASLEQLEEHYGALPNTVELTTGGGGKQYLFNWPGFTVGNSANKLGEGLDTRGANGYIVIAPSVHPSGGIYEGNVERDKITDAPPWLLAQLASKKEALQANQTATSMTIKKGSRNARMTTLAGSMRRHGFPKAAILAALKQVNEECCTEKLEISELETISSSIGRKDPAYNIDGSIAYEWGEPLPLDVTIGLPTFPTECLPKVIREFVLAVVESTQTPAALAGVSVLGVLATACQKVAYIRLSEDHTENLNLYTLVALPPGTRKSAVISLVCAPIEEHTRELEEELEPLIRFAAEHLEILEGKLKNAKKEASKSDDPEVRERVAALIEELATHEKSMPVKPRLIVSDVTPERMVSLLDKQGGKLTNISTEAEIFSQISGRYSQNNMPNLDPFLKAHCGDTIRVDRVGREEEVVYDPRLTILAAIQPTIIEGLAAQRDFRGRGLLGRFLFSLPQSPLGTRRFDSEPIHPRTKKEYNRLIKALLSLEPQGARELWQVSLSAEARRLFIEAGQALEERLKPRGDLLYMSDWAGKLMGAIGRLAGLLHFAEYFEEGCVVQAPWHVEVSAETMQNALKLGDYFTAHAQAAFSLAGAEDSLGDAKYLWGQIQATEKHVLENQELWQKVKGKFRGGKSAMDAALRLLEDYNLIRLQREDKAKQGRPKAPTIYVNPATP